MMPMTGCKNPQAGLDAHTRAVVDRDNPSDARYGFRKLVRVAANKRLKSVATYASMRYDHRPDRLKAPEATGQTQEADISELSSVQESRLLLAGVHPLQAEFVDTVGGLESRLREILHSIVSYRGLKAILQFTLKQKAFPNELAYA
jgi:hypothetical protein